jgi:hypothetical protein
MTQTLLQHALGAHGIIVAVQLDHGEGVRQECYIFVLPAIARSKEGQPLLEDAARTLHLPHG